MHSEFPVLQHINSDFRNEVLMNKAITLTVSQLNEYVGAILGSAELLSDIYIKGEISNFTNHYKSGHFYFTLKDETGNLKAVMFRSYASLVPFEPENGMKVTAHGRIAVYERDGIYQLYCDELVPDGIGSLYLAFEQLKEKLSREGLFDEEYKKPIPEYPSKIGIITSETGAAIADLTNILTRRYPCCELILFPALVQGSGAPASLINGIKYFDGKVDTIIIGRGGGSIEDLWGFNDEKLARTIFACETPVISAVGHEIDFTICDFVADLRAPTPSAAAELAVPDITDLKYTLSALEKRLNYSIENKLESLRSRIASVSDMQFFKSPLYYLDKKRTDLASSEVRFTNAFERHISDKRSELSKISAKMTALNPLAVLSRGYGAVYGKDGNVISSVEGIGVGEEFSVEMCDGSVKASAVEIKKKSKSGKANNK